MVNRNISAMDRALARLCGVCPICRHARKKQEGAAYRLVSHIETGICPFCRAYEKVHGRKAHEPIQFPGP